MNDPNDLGLWQRPQLQLRSLPLKIRWEVTRRHPIYQIFWRPFNLDLGKGEDVQRQAESALSKLGRFLLSAICVGVREDPSTEFEQLGEGDLKSGWMSGAVHPLTNRQLAILLIASLPDKALSEVGLCMMNAALAKDIGGEPRKESEIIKLNDMTHEGLDGFVGSQMVSINPAASSRDVKQSIDKLLIEWKDELGLSQQRIPSEDKLLTYLEVWDLREGWSQGHYERAAESSFREIAENRKVSVKTIHNQYKSAFELITGHTYSIGNWVELFGSLKLNALFGNLGRAARLRPLIERTRREIPESVVSSNQLPDFISTNAVSEDIPVAELVAALKGLIAAEKTDEDIAAELNLQHPEYLPTLRERIADA